MNLVIQTLAEINSKIVATAKLQAVPGLICDSILRLLNVPKALILLYDVNGEAHVKESRGLGAPGKMETELISLSRLDSAGTSRERGKIILREDIPADDPSFGRLRAVEDIRACLRLPLVAEDWRAGELWVFDVLPRAWKEEDVQILRLFADQTAITMQKANLLDEALSQGQENSRLHEAEQQRTTYLAALQRLSNELATLHEVRSVLDTLAVRAATQMGNYDCAVLLVASGKGPGVLSAQFGLTDGPPLGTAMAISSPLLVNALANGEPFITSDFHRDLPDLQSTIRSDAQAVFIYPMVWQAKATGFICLSSRSTRMPPPEEITAFQLLAERAAAALENARLFEETHHRLAELEAIHKISTSLRSAQTLDEMMPVFLDRTLEVLGVTAGMISLFDPTAQELRPVALRGWFQDVIGEGSPAAAGIVGKALASDEIFMTGDLTNDPRLEPASRTAIPQGMAGICLPIRSIHETVGEIFVSESLPRVFSDDDAHLLTTLAEIAGNAIHRTRLHEQLERRAQELHARNLELARLYRASGSLISSVTLDTQAMGQAIVDTIRQEFGQSNCSLVVVQEGSQDLLRITVAGPYADQLDRRKISLYGPGLLAKAIRTGQVSNVPDVSICPDYVANWPAARSELTIPLKIGSEVIGALDLQSMELNAFNASDEHLMTIFAERAALALSNTRLYEQTMRSLQRLTAFRTIDQAISASMDLRVTLNILLDQVISQLGVDASAILLYNAESQILEYSAVRGFRTRKIEHTRIRLSEGNAGRVAFERRPIQLLALPEVADAITRFQPFTGEQFVSYFGLPLIAKGQLRGVLEIFHRSALTPDQDWLDFLETLARQAAIALDNVALFENLQRSNSELTLAYDAVIEGWSQALEMRYPYQKDHAQRTAELTVRLGRAMKVSEADLVHARRGALLHDIGEIAIPDDILKKKGALTEQEWQIVRQHPVFAFELLSPIRNLQLAADIPHCHHERWDGQGYPLGLMGEHIPLLARIFAVVDVWDALCSPRPHRAAWAPDDAREYIRNQSGKGYDPLIVDTFMTLPDLS